MDEITPVPGWEGRYSVTRDGRVWSHFNDIWLKQCDDGDGYLSVTMRKDGRQYCSRVHRLVGMTFLGLKPKELIDHKDRNRHNNAVDNLRLCTNSQNQHNTVRWKTNKSGFKGVSKSDNKWVAAIKVKGKTNGIKYLGLFSTPEEAHARYCEEAALLMGDFARTA